MSDAKLPGWLTKTLGKKTEWKAKIEKTTGLRLLEPLGCGHFGCAFKTDDPKWVVKISRDPTEGPMQAMIAKRQKEGDYGFDGFAIVRAVYKLNVTTLWKGKEWPVYVIVREEVTPFTAIYKSHGSGDVELVSPRTDHQLAERAIGAMHDYKDYAAKWYATKRYPVKVYVRKYGLPEPTTVRSKDELESMMHDKLSRVSDAFPYLGQIMEIMQAEGQPMRDVHWNNIGVRVHQIDNDSSIGAVVIFDPGHTPSGEDPANIATINPARRARKNPGCGKTHPCRKCKNDFKCDDSACDPDDLGVCRDCHEAAEEERDADEFLEGWRDVRGGSPSMSDYQFFLANRKRAKKNPASDGGAEEADLRVPGLSFDPSVDFDWPSSTGAPLKKVKRGSGFAWATDPSWADLASFRVIIGNHLQFDPNNDFDMGDEDEILKAIEKQFGVKNASWMDGAWIERGRGYEGAYTRYGTAHLTDEQKKKLKQQAKG
jgi:hypothetical protein